MSFLTDLGHRIANRHYTGDKSSCTPCTHVLCCYSAEECSINFGNLAPSPSLLNDNCCVHEIKNIYLKKKQKKKHISTSLLCLNPVLHFHRLLLGVFFNFFFLVIFFTVFLFFTSSSFDSCSFCGLVDLE